MLQGCVGIPAQPRAFAAVWSRPFLLLNKFKLRIQIKVSIYLVAQMPLSTVLYITSLGRVVSLTGHLQLPLQRWQVCLLVGGILSGESSATSSASSFVAATSSSAKTSSSSSTSVNSVQLFNLLLETTELCCFLAFLTCIAVPCLNGELYHPRRAQRSILRSCSSQ